ncbi:MAG TPA: M20/M25/M40 family metallo-hydrolase [Longimicrobiales bacterium]|nr:M20/M25/M40 family metallo-hydrolase [Longimicrobiales bacterium]
MVSSLLVVASLVTFQQPQTWTYQAGRIDAQQQIALDIYKELVEINSSVTTGNITTAAQAMAKHFADAGIPPEDIFVGGPVPKRHNVVARIRGRNPNRSPLLLLAHLDVVEALKSDWSDDLDPFVFTERDGYYYGRGTDDDKAMAAIFVANVFRMKAEGFVPDRDIIIALTSDEESGPYDGAGWLVENHFDLVDAGLVINEGGGGVHDKGTPVYQGVQAAEKITTNFTLRVTNPGGHSSVPRADNAITALADALGKVGRFSFPVHLNPVTQAYFTEMAKLEAPAMGRAMAAMVADPSDEAALAVVTSDPRYRAMLETTCVATMLSGGHASNALPQLAEANVNCRVYPTETAPEVQEVLQRVVDDPTVEVLIKSQRPPTPPSELLPEVMEPVGRITRDMWGDIPVIPTMSTGATDSRWFRARGIPALGVSGLFADPSVDARAHGRDERMRVQSFFEGHEFLYRLTRALAGPNPIS